MEISSQMLKPSMAINPATTRICSGLPAAVTELTQFDEGWAQFFQGEAQMFGWRDVGVVFLFQQTRRQGDVALELQICEKRAKTVPRQHRHDFAIAF
jgi:hypothetical protein